MAAVEGPEHHANYLAGVPKSAVPKIDMIIHNEVCIYPDEFYEILSRAKSGARVNIEVDGEDAGTVVSAYKHTVVAKIDTYTLDWIHRLQRKYGLTTSAILRLGVFLLREVLEKGQVEV